MTNLGDLPFELFTAVLDLALYDESDTQRLCRLALLSRRWYAALLGRIYNKWSYNGARQPFMTLWKFVCTIRRNVHIASLVRRLNVANWGFYPRAVAGRPPSKIQLPPDEKELIRSAIHDLGLGHIEDDIFDSLSRRDRRPLMVILLASVSNLSILYAHVPSSDPILGYVLKRSLDDGTFMTSYCPLRELKELYLLHELPVLAQKNDSAGHETYETILNTDLCEPKPYLTLDYLWPVFYLPNLRTLSLWDLDPQQAAEYLGQHTAVSHVKNLYLLGYWAGVFNITNTECFFTRTEGLKSLSIFIQEDILISGLKTSQIWGCMLKHKDSIESVDIYRDATAHVDENGHFGLLREFTSLKHVRVQLEMLLGGCCDSPLAPFRLRDTLPVTIEDLRLYGYEGYDVVLDLPDQVHELLSGEFQTLKSITLEEVEAVVHDNGKIKEPYQRLKEVCSEKGIILQIEKRDWLPKGGNCMDSWAETWCMRKDGIQRALAISEKFRDHEELLLHSAENAHHGKKRRT